MKRHEELRDDLVIYDATDDVADGQMRGEVFVFLSHQWLGYGSPDPNGVHAAARVESKWMHPVRLD